MLCLHILLSLLCLIFCILSYFIFQLYIIFFSSIRMALNAYKHYRSKNPIASPNKKRKTHVFIALLLS